ncbi:MAG: adenine phosphoribosyltransferase [Alphaproteobacteria bacterium]|nr:adenine phosphoribosyltransferase [Candidatus Fonsibacter sp. PEL55]
MNLKNFVRSIPDYPKKGILFRDITSLIENTRAFNYSLKKMYTISKKINHTKIAGIESRGFIFASALAYLNKKPLVLLRKKNKLPGKKISQKFKLEYGTDTIEIHKSSLNKNDKVIIVDDLIATGGTALASAKLIEKTKANVSAFIFLIDLFDLPGNKKLQSEGYRTFKLINFPGH